MAAPRVRQSNAPQEFFASEPGTRIQPVGAVVSGRDHRAVGFPDPACVGNGAWARPADRLPKPPKAAGSMCSNVRG